MFPLRRKNKRIYQAGDWNSQKKRMLSSECIKNTNRFVGNCWKNIEKTPNKNSAIESKENNKTVHWRWMTFLSPLFFVNLALVTYRVIWACVFCVFFVCFSFSILFTIIHFQIDSKRMEYRTRCQWKREKKFY